jgi:hypothetical protein
MTITETLPAEPMPVEPVPRIYLACPLTNLALARRGTVGLTIDVIRTSVEAVTFNATLPATAGPSRCTRRTTTPPPGTSDGLSSSAVYEKNLTELLESDALIVVADQGASAGVGQEIEWASRAGLPILYLTTPTASRQIAGIPAHITCVAYGDDITTCETTSHRWSVNQSGRTPASRQPSRVPSPALARLPKSSRRRPARRTTARHQPPRTAGVRPGQPFQLPRRSGVAGQRDGNRPIPTRGRIGH